MKYRLLAIFMVFLYIFSSITVFASETSTDGSTQEDTIIIEETTSENSTTEENTDSSSSDFSPIQTPSDGGCIIEPSSSSGLSLASEGIMLMDAASGSVLYSKNADTKFYPASITKIVTTLVAIENGNLSDSLTCNAETLYAIEQDSSRIGLEAGEIISLEDGLYFVMLASGNDAAACVAEHIGGTVEGFVNMMNEKVKEIGCTNTHFTNPHGLHNEEHYTTARDMALIMQAATSNPTFCKIASSTNFTVPATNLNEERPTWNHHKMILPASEYHYEGVCEGKTGYTSIALNTLVTTAERNGIKLISVVLHCPGGGYTYSDTKKLFDYGFNNFSILRPLDNFNLKTAAEEAGLSEENMEKLTRYNAIYNTDYTVLAPSDVSVEDISVTFSSDGPADGVFGKLHVSYNGEEIGTLNVYYDVDEEYKSIANEDTDVTISAIANVPFLLVAIMAILILLIIFLAASIIMRP